VRTAPVVARVVPGVTFQISNFEVNEVTTWQRRAPAAEAYKCCCASAMKLATWADAIALHTTLRTRICIKENVVEKTVKGCRTARVALADLLRGAAELPVAPDPAGKLVEAI